MLFEVKKGLEGLKHNIGFRGKGVAVHRGRGRYVHCSKRGHFMEVSQHSCPSLEEEVGRR